MRVAVLGAGVIGVTSAWYLARAGHEVTLVDRQAGVGLETSFANGGQVSAGEGCSARTVANTARSPSSTSAMARSMRPIRRAMRGV